MGTGKRSNALLVELLIVVMFFMLASTVLVRVFSAARQESDRAEKLALALNCAQNAADSLRACGDPAAFLASEGFTQEGGAWVLEKDGVTYTVTTEDEVRPGGVMRRQCVAASLGSEELLSLPCSVFREVGE